MLRRFHDFKHYTSEALMMKAMQHYTIYHQSEGVYAQIIVKKGRMQVPS